MSRRTLPDGTVLTQSESNSNIAYDNTHREKELEWAGKVIENDSFDPEIVGRAFLKEDIFESISLILLYDMHYGGPGCNVIKARKTVGFMNITPNAYGIGGGDNVDCSYGTSNTADQKIRTDLAEDELVNDLAPIAPKIVAMVPGNHDGKDGKRNAFASIDRAKSVADRLGVRYFPYGFVLTIDGLPLPGTNKTRPMNGFFFHASGSSGGRGSAVDTTWREAQNALQNLADKGVIIDFIAGGHFHADANRTLSQEYNEYAPSGEAIGRKRRNIKIISCPSLQGMGPYPASNNMAPNDTNVAVVNLRWKQNSYSTNKEGVTEEEYSIECCQFPMFQEASTEFSAIAEKHMKTYHENTKEYAEFEKACSKCDTVHLLRTLYSITKGPKSKETPAQNPKGENITQEE